MEQQICKIMTESEMDEWLWTLAANGQVINKDMRHQMTQLIDDEEQRERLSDRLRRFNHVVQACYNEPGCPVHELTAARRRLGQRNAEHNHALYEYKRRLNIEFMMYRQRHKGSRLVAQHLLKQLRNPNSRISRAYDLMRELDVEDYLGWFRLWRWRFPLALLDKIERTRNGGRPLTVLRQMVEAHNRQFTEMGPE